MDRAAAQAWVDAYERAWRTAGTEPVRALFAEDATYSMGPYEAVERGIAAIEALWERERVSHDEPFTMTSEIVAAEGDVAVARLEVHYQATGNEFRDLWVMRFAADGRCVAFEEWPFAPE
ncbi:MAG TPA: nuclear transport factor 2 family protein [Acidimicrobiia bacterium]|nr:nuclear transport factor 2 family protein [Acidimicrobiia bacterium]